jgi:toxin ParE1/3/4
MVEVIVSPQARADIIGIIDYLRCEASLGVTRKWHARLWQKIQDIGESPGIGAPRRKFGRHVRIRIVGPYLIIYEHQRGEPVAHVLRVVSGSRRITRKFVRSTTA